MKRRKFIANSLKGAVVPFFIGGFGVQSRAAATFLPSGVCDFDDRALVVIHLNGANDIINAAVPLNQLGAYRSNRSSIYLPTNSLITLDSTLGDSQQLGLNPALQSFKSLYDDGTLGIVQRAGYPLPNRSHFAAESIMLRGVQGGSNQNEEEGWIGRFLKDRYATYQGLPFGQEQDPLGIMLGKGSDAGFHTNEEHDFHLNLTGQDPAGFFNIISSLSGEPIEQFPNSDHGNVLEYISAIERSTQVYSGRITDVFNAGANQKAYPDSEIGSQLKTIARFLSGGSRTKVFFARTGGWDTHVNEVDTTDTTKGKHADLLKDLSDAIKAFQEDLTLLGVNQRVTTVIFSEFGRKIIQNERGGTDHGTLSSMFVVGSGVNGGVYGNNINLSQQDNRGAADPAQLENDYRSVFASLLQDWMGASDASVQNSFPNTSSSILTNKLPIISPNQTVSGDCLCPPGDTDAIKVQLTVQLEGLYNPTLGTMSSALVANDFLTKEQPFANATFNYFGEEQVEEFPTGTVDWLLLELRNTTDYSTVARQAVLLRADGKTINTKGESTITFEDIFPDNYYLAVFHPAHIGIVSRATTSNDLTQTNTFQLNNPDSVRGTNQLKQKGTAFVMVVGDTDQNGSINAADYVQFIEKIGAKGYAPSDLDGSGLIELKESELLKNNSSRMGYPKLFPQLKL